MRGRKPKPAAEKLARGNPGRYPVKPDPPQLEPVRPDAPGHLNAEGKAEWERVVTTLYALRVLTDIDIAVLGAYCHAYAQWKQAVEAINRMAEHDLLTKGLMIKTTNGNAIQNPLVGTANKAASDMVRFAAELGMTPSARARLAQGPSAEAADLAEKYFN